jgi:hypothetical protein
MVGFDEGVSRLTVAALFFEEKFDSIVATVVLPAV